VVYAWLLAQGWSDAVRTLHPDAPMYSYWSSYRWPHDAGLRIDHLLLSKEVAPRFLAAGVDRDVRGADNASDHAPVWIELRDAPRAIRKMLRAGTSSPSRTKPRSPSG
jgi:exodeoxyribonuclease III